MKRFAKLFQQLDETNKTNLKVAAMADYFREAPPEDRVWAIALMSSRRPPRPVKTPLLRQWASEAATIPLWLFEESYHVVGDLAETIALLTGDSSDEEHASDEQTLSEWMQLILRLRKMPEEEQHETLLEAWSVLGYRENFVFNKLLTGSFRVGVSRKLMTRALAQAFDLEENALAHRIMGKWDPTGITFDELIFEHDHRDKASQPYPFYLAYSVEDRSEPITQEDPNDWHAEWKWDGIRGQLVKRNGELFVWSRGEELVTDKYPEFEAFAPAIPDGTVLDGEIMAWQEDMPLNFHALQQRIGRKTLSRKILEEVPVVFMAYDLIEWKSEDLRSNSLESRRKKLEELNEKIQSPNLLLSPSIPFEAWEDLELLISEARARACEGFMLKHVRSEYEVGRKKGNWWKWKSDPFTIDAVLTFAMRGHGRRANLYTDYTFGLWHDGELVTFAKAYSGLTDKEFNQVDRFVKRNTIERFGPVRQVTPQLVFELAFEGIALSKRHKSGVAVRFPRIIRWRHDKKPEDANTLDDLIALIPKNVE